MEGLCILSNAQPFLLFGDIYGMTTTAQPEL